jgi:hypothetical protein
MTNLIPTFLSEWHERLALSILATLLCLNVFAQTQSADQERRGTKDQATAAAEQKISPQEAQELFRSVDEILKIVSQDTGLPIKEPVKRRLTSRDEVVAYVSKHMAEDEDAQRLRRSEAVLKKFGLLPRDFDLEKFLIAVLREQVAGYYDPKTRYVNLLNWLEAEQQKPVMAHELTHALQDQSFHLEKWMQQGETDLGTKKQPTPVDIANDEVTAARQAVVEGQAMVTLINYLLLPTGQNVISAPQMVDAMKVGMSTGTIDSVEFRNAPLYLKKALTFGYLYGLDFTIELLKAGGKQKAFAGAFANPPRTTREIMEPATYLSSEKVAPVSLPDFENDFKDYERYDIGAIGEFDVAILLEQYAGEKVSQVLYPQWRGGYYYAVRSKKDPSSPIGLLYVSRWANSVSAEKVAGIYAGSLKTRYKTVEPAQSSNDTRVDQRTWKTDEGVVVIARKDDLVMVTESLDSETTRKLTKNLLHADLVTSVAAK